MCGETFNYPHQNLSIYSHGNCESYFSLSYMEKWLQEVEKLANEVTHMLRKFNYSPVRYILFTYYNFNLSYIFYFSEHISTRKKMNIII